MSWAKAGAAASAAAATPASRRSDIPVMDGSSRSGEPPSVGSAPARRKPKLTRRSSTAQHHAFAGGDDLACIGAGGFGEAGEDTADQQRGADPRRSVAGQTE